MPCKKKFIFSRDAFCPVCPNGCHLKILLSADGKIQATGNRCERGLKFAYHLLRKAHRQGEVPLDKKDIQCDLPEKPCPYSRLMLAEIVGVWGIDLEDIHEHIDIEGSPERADFRLVIEDRKGHFYILEKILPETRANKLRIARTLDLLERKGLSAVRPYLPLGNSEFIHKSIDGFWQITTFEKGAHLHRQRYIYEGWRGKALASFLIELRKASSYLSHQLKGEVFSLKEYILRLVDRIKQYHPDLMKRLTPVLTFLDSGWTDRYEACPLAFCHGDFHPLNMIWNFDSIRAVIDWEFSGMKPDIYDAALLVGCVGMEHPSSLTGDLVLAFLTDVRSAGIGSPLSWKYFVEFIVATRFAWLSEWLRKEDSEMIELELVYMNLFIDHRHDLQQSWSLLSVNQK